MLFFRPSESKLHDDPMSVLVPVGERECAVYVQVAASENRVSTRGSCADTECAVQNYILSEGRVHELGANADLEELISEADLEKVESYCGRLCYWGASTSTGEASSDPELTD